MGDRVVPIDRRTRVARRVRDSLGKEPEGKRRGRPCHVCRAHETGHPRCQEVRPLVDAGHSRGVTDAELARRVGDLCEGWPPRDVPSLSSIRNHVSFHVADTVRLARAIAEERIRQVGESETRLTEQYIDPVVDTHLILALVSRDLVATGRIVPKDVGEILKVMEAWGRVRPAREPDGVSVEEYQRGVAAVVEAARRLMTKDAYAQLLADLQGSGRELREP